MRHTDHGTAKGRNTALRGTNQTGMRQSNERLVLSLVRSHKALPRAEIARLTGLSAQTVSVIMRALEHDGLLTRGEPRRGHVGQPSVPMSLAADGAFFLGLKVGRRSMELVLADLHGAIRGRRMQRHDWPTPDAAITFAGCAAAELIARLPRPLQDRIAGMGVATPFRLWDWADRLGAPQGAMDAWRDCDLRTELMARQPLPVFLENDATAACRAELVFGTTPLPANFVHVYIGFFIGGGVVLNGSLHPGHNGNAGALGSMPVRDAQGRTVQLIDLASTSRLEMALIADGQSPDLIWASPDHWPVCGSLLQAWIETAADGLAQAAVASQSVIDFQAMVIDGWMPRAIRRRLLDATRCALGRQNTAGLESMTLIEGSIGADARALGAAALPLANRFGTDRPRA